MNKPVLDAQTLQNLAEGDRAVISGFQGTIQVGYGVSRTAELAAPPKGNSKQTCGTLRTLSVCYLWIFMDLL